MTLLLACRDSRKPVPQKSDVPEPERRDVSISAHTFEPPKVQLPLQLQVALIDAGKPPHAPLRYERPKSQTSYLADTRLTTRRLANREWGKAETLAAIRNGLVVSVAPAGEPVQFRVLPAEVLGNPTPGTAAYLSGWRAIEGRRLTVEVDDRGQLGAVTFADDVQNLRSQAAIDEMTQRLLTLLVPLPAEPVGVGAQWRVIWALRQHPLVVRQTATYKLLRRTNAKWTIEIDVRRTGEPQMILDPSIPEGTAVELVAMVRRLSGTVQLDADQLMPTGKLEVSSSMHVRIRQKKVGESEEIVEDSGEIVLSSKPVE